MKLFVNWRSWLIDGGGGGVPFVWIYGNVGGGKGCRNNDAFTGNGRRLVTIEARRHQSCRFSSYHYLATTGKNSIEKVLKVICYNSTNRKKGEIFSFNSPRVLVVRSGMSFPSGYLPRPGFKYHTVRYPGRRGC